MTAKTVTYLIVGLIFLFSGLVYHERVKADDDLPKGKLIPGMAVSIGSDVKHIPEIGDDGDVLFVEFTGRYNKTPWGFNTYLGRVVDPDMWVVGAEPTFRWKRITLGLGLAYLDDITYANGTQWNFSISGCGEITSIFDICFRHWSHGGSFGIKKDVSNRGWNMLMARFKTNSGKSSKVFLSNRWYVGVGYSQSMSDLGFNDRVQEKIIENEYQDEIALLESVGAPLKLSNGFRNSGFKIFTGYRFGENRKWAFEAAYADLGTYEASVSTALALSGSGEGTVDGIPVEADGTITGFAGINARAQIRALSISFVRSFQISNRVSVFPRIGFAHLFGKIKTSESVSYSYNVNGTVGGVTPVYENGGETSTDINKSVFRSNIIPLIGAGVDIAAFDKYSVRVEYERYGHPSHDPSISVWTVSGIRRW